MSDTPLSTGKSGSYGAATARAREQNSNAGEEARKNRIAELRQQYLAGTYQVDAQELSAALIQRHLAKDN